MRKFNSTSSERNILWVSYNFDINLHNFFEIYCILLFIAEGDWSFQAFFRKAWKKNPKNPVNPVKKLEFKIESIPLNTIISLEFIAVVKNMFRLGPSRRR